MSNTTVRVYPCSCIQDYGRLIEACEIGRQHDEAHLRALEQVYMVESYPEDFSQFQHAEAHFQERVTRAFMRMHLGDDYREIDLKEVC